MKYPLVRPPEGARGLVPRSDVRKTSSRRGGWGFEDAFFSVYRESSRVFRQLVWEI